jgi:predicted dehydrogenase
VSRRAGVVGTSFGARIHVPALRQAGFEVVALVGVDPDKTARRADRFGIPHPCTSLSDALALGLDAISIAGPPATHAPLASEAIASGCHVLCEKPFTLNAAEAERLVGEAAAAGVVTVLGHEFRWSLGQATMAWAIERGLVGTPRLFVSASFISMLRTFRMPSWWFDPAQGGGWLNASGSHRIDGLHQWFGDVAAVSAGLPDVSDPPLGVDDSFTIRCLMRNGVDVSLIQSSAAAGPGAGMTRLVGTRGTLWADGDTVRLADDDDPSGRVLEPPPELVLPDVDTLATGALAEMTLMELPPYIRLAQAFMAAIEGEPPLPGPQPATFEDGLACMRVIDAVRQSAATRGQWITLEHNSRQEGGAA